MNTNQQCLIQILQDQGGPLTTREVLAHTDDYPELCKGCSSGSAVISAGLELMKTEIITREVGKGGFIWKLNPKTKNQTHQK